MHSIQKAAGFFAVLVAICFAHPATVFGQSTTQLQGRVLVPAGTAQVTLYSDDRVRTEVTDDYGYFKFSGLTAPGRFLEASAEGFATASVRVGASPPDRVMIKLSLGSRSHGIPRVDVRDGHTPLVDVAPHSVGYEERYGREQVSGTVGEYLGPFLDHVSLILKKADLDGPRAAASFAKPNVSMSQRNFDYSLVAQTFSDEKGRFHFSGLEPGWYSLETSYDGYDPEVRYFWIARETLTRPSTIEIVPRGGASPLEPAQQTTPLVRPQ